MFWERRFILFSAEMRSNLLIDMVIMEILRFFKSLGPGATGLPITTSSAISQVQQTKEVVQPILVKEQRGIYTPSRNLDSNFRC